MWRSPGSFSFIIRRLNQFHVNSVQSNHALNSKTVIAPFSSAVTHSKLREDQFAFQSTSQTSDQKFVEAQKPNIGENVSKRDKINYLVTTLLDLNDSKEAIYGALDAWVAWEQQFPMVSLKRALIALEKEQQWRRIVQVIKWMLSKGQGTTMGTYGQLLRALDMDHRAKEAHEFWDKKIGTDLHSVPWELCHLMISVYYRNNMLQDLVRLFKGLEAFDRKPRDKLIIQKVANAYEILGLLQEKERVLEKYSYLFAEEGPTQKPKRKKRYLYTEKGQPKESRMAVSVKK